MTDHIIPKLFYSIIASALCGIALYCMWTHNFKFFQWAMDKKLWIASAVIIIITASTSWAYRSNLNQLFLFTFSPTKFIEHSVEAAIQSECKTNSGFKEHIESNEDYKKAKTEEFSKQFTNSTRELRGTICRAFVMVLLILVCSVLSAYILVNYISFNEKQLLMIQVISAFLILWALMGKLGLGIQTFSGTTLPEQINNFWFLLLNVVGIYFLFFANFFSLFKK